MTIEEQLKREAHRLGFSMCGIAPAEPSPRLDAYLRWAKAGMHGTMGWMVRDDRVIRREDLSVIVPEARSMVIVALDYHTDIVPEDVRRDPLRGRISNYAWGVDYHDVMLPQLKKLASFLVEAVGGEVATKAYVDTGAILERSHAEQAGLGFTGKNTMLIHPQRGSYFFLGEIITDAALTPDEPAEMPGCGTCTRCLSACPTDAFPKPYVLDARRCISYLTIENKGPIPDEFRPLMGNWVYGCDICQEVCPWQRFAEPTTLDLFAPDHIDRAAPPLADLLMLDEARFKAMFAGSPIVRIKRERMVRNACIVAGNSGHTVFIPLLRPLLEDESPLVREHAAWALDALG